MLFYLVTLGASLSENMLTGKRRISAVNRKNWIMRKILIPPQSLTNFEIQRYCHIASRFNGAYSRNNLDNTTMDRVYVIYLDEY